MTFKTRNVGKIKAQTYFPYEAIQAGCRLLKISDTTQNCVVLFSTTQFLYLILRISELR